MPVHVKMLDKDGVGFRHITVEDPVCIQLLATDPLTHDLPVLRVGHIPNCFYYPLTNDAYIMNELGGTISKISFKDCLREIGKEKVPGMRPNRKGLKDLPPYPHSLRPLPNAFAHLNMASEEPIEQKDPYVIDVDVNVACLNNSHQTWYCHLKGKGVDVLSLSPADLMEMMIAYTDEDEETFVKWFKDNHTGTKEYIQECLKVIKRCSKLLQYHYNVTGSYSPEYNFRFTPVTFNEATDSYVYTIDGVDFPLNEVTLAVILKNNLFFVDPLAVNITKIKVADNLMQLMLEASTVFYYNSPTLKGSPIEMGDSKWIDFTFASFPLEESKKESPNFIDVPYREGLFNCLRLIDGEFQAVINGSNVPLNYITVEELIKNRIYLSDKSLLDFNNWASSKQSILYMDKDFGLKWDVVTGISAIRSEVLKSYGNPSDDLFIRFRPLIVKNNQVWISHGDNGTEFELCDYEKRPSSAVVLSEEFGGNITVHAQLIRNTITMNILQGDNNKVGFQYSIEEIAKYFYSQDCKK